MRRFCVPALGAVLLVLAACSGGGGGGSDGPESSFLLGDPIEGLPPDQLLSFERGRELMSKKFTPTEGLGPYYNVTSCAACHDKPVVGGSAPNYRNFFISAVGPQGFQTPIPTQTPALGPLPSVVVPSYSVGPQGNLDIARVTIPAGSVGPLPVTTLMRNAPPLFGVGLFEFVSDATIMGLADPDDTDGDGISGRFNSNAMGHIGRFGYKSQANNVEVFIRGAMQNQLGITTDPVLGNGAVVSLAGGMAPQASSGQTTPTTDADAIPDPEVSSQEFGDIIAFCRFIAPPEPLPMTAAAERGLALFTQLACDKCHVPTLPSSVGPLNAYTDLLIHDMGPELADGLTQGFPQPAANQPFTTGSEFRTQPLWGVRLTAPFLHDGRADTLDDAIRAHGGEGDAAKNAYLGLTQAERDDLIAFLETL